MTEQEQEEAFKKSIASLKETLDLHGIAEAGEPPWGYALPCWVERLPDGKAKVTTYHMESEFRTNTYDDEEQVIYALYTEDASPEGKAIWHPGIWNNPS